eukprot:COSAG06_NODE_24655_length_656_cov_1.420108_1_plen_82_part_00
MRDGSTTLPTLMCPPSARIRGPSGVRSAVLWLSAAPALPARPGYGSVSAENSAPRKQRTRITGVLRDMPLLAHVGDKDLVT